MRTIPFRDILYAIAYKVGEDPNRDDFLTNQAIAVGAYINSWVRRIWPSTDWPELTFTKIFTPVNHIVGYDIMFTDVNHLPDPGLTKMGRVLKVFLNDPAVTEGPQETKFTLKDTGVHCGFEHGTNVWIKYIGYPQTYTAESWDVNRIYRRNEVTYSPEKGEVYRSKINNNHGNDPAFEFIPAPPPVQITQQATPDDPGLPAQTKKVTVYCTLLNVPAGTSTPPTIANPPPNLSQFYIPVMDSTGTLLTSKSHTANGVETKVAIFTALQVALAADAALSAFTITLDTSDPNNPAINLEAASDFQIDRYDGTNHAFYIPAGGPTFILKAVQSKTYFASVSPSFGSPQKLQVGLSDDQMMPGATYSLSFIDTLGVEHTVEYVASDFDGPNQVMAGLLSAFHAEQLTDDFLQKIGSSLDTSGTSATFTTPNRVSLHSLISIPTSPYWDVVLFPAVLADPIIRGARADALKEMGQEDKGLAEEQLVPTESDAKQATISSRPFNALTDQQQQASKYRIGG